MNSTFYEFIKDNHVIAEGVGKYYIRKTEYEYGLIVEFPV